MAMNSLDNLSAVLKNEHDVSHEIHIDEPIRKKALKPIERMLEFSRSQGKV
jgi:quinolinate synthase